ncbi:hypothetical protein [Longitalea luteola]|uniref:hypothetical protein n=1 Tax=Longitalea luteola TaxID=2812563 RepID=UPI001A96511E|nr:hypothetical protein [Longitalea luteola]
MKVYIIEKEPENEYGIVKVAANLVAEFELLHRDKIVDEGNSIHDVLTKFVGLERRLVMSWSLCQPSSKTIDCEPAVSLG